jgi:3-hydroxyisobutyrate dehydrogenase-like beta-hydroxyacid dehydrogenase
MNEMEQVASLPVVAFIGTGLMGYPMVLRLLQANYSVRVWNRTRAKAERLSPHGAHVADTPADAVMNADIVITMLEAGPVVAEAIERARSGLQSNALFIDMSSTRPSEAKEFNAILMAASCRFIDAPVSGGVLGAEGGTLAIMVGGSPADFADAEQLLQVLGKSTLVGPVGSGQVAKLCNQLIVGGTLNIVAEALLLAQAGGANPAAVRVALRGGFADSRILEIHGQRMLDRDFMPGGQVKSQTKDLDNVLDAADKVGITLPVAELITQNYRHILESCPSADQSAILLSLESLNPGQRLGNAPDRLPD